MAHIAITPFQSQSALVRACRIPNPSTPDSREHMLSRSPQSSDPVVCLFMCMCACLLVYRYSCTNAYPYMYRLIRTQRVATGWRRLIGSPKLQIIFHKRATKYRSLLRKMTYKDKGSYESLPPCTAFVVELSRVFMDL